VLIYFSPDLQRRVFDKLYKALDEKGFLVLGDSESLITLTNEYMITLDSRNRIYQKG
jgi:chemotaxis methyl-accepting protein methylase